jgi:hypothetical protein
MIRECSGNNAATAGANFSWAWRRDSNYRFPAILKRRSWGTTAPPLFSRNSAQDTLTAF